MASDKKGEKAEKKGSDSEKPNEMLKRYIAMFPFIRKEELGELASNPNKALPKEIDSSSIGKGLKDAVVTALIFTTIASLFWLIFSIPALMPILGSVPTIAVMVLSVYVVSLVVAVIFTVLGLAITACVYYIIARLLGGKGPFGKTMGMLGTISGPINLLNIALLVLAGILMAIVGAFVPSVWNVAYLFVVLGGIALVFFQLYLNYKMVRMLHGLSRGRSVAVVAIPILALIAIIVTLLLWIMSILATMASMVPH